MFKCFCDVCGNEIPQKRAGKRLLFKKGRVTAEIMVAVDDTWNAGHVCAECLKEVFRSGEESVKR
jgi:hypothetical protein